MSKDLKMKQKLLEDVIEKLHMLPESMKETEDKKGAEKPKKKKEDDEDEDSEASESSESEE
jgi:hypothetical protein